MPEPVDNEISNASEKLKILDEQPYEEKCSVSSKFSIFKPQILPAIDHIKDISHKRPDLDASFDFIRKSTTSNIDKEAIKGFIAQSLEQKIILNKRSQTGNDSYRRITITMTPAHSTIISI